MRNRRKWVVFVASFPFLYALSATAQAIAACDGPGPVPVSVTVSSAGIPESGGSSARFVFAMPQALGSDVHLALLVAGTATNGVDYQTIPSTATIPGTQTEAALTVTPLPDTVVEGSETVTVTITGVDNPCASVGSPNSATLSIVDGDASDLDGDGNADLVWWNSTTGASAAWLMNGASATASAFLAAPGNWVPVLRADLDGDGFSDVVWRNSSTGATAVWLMQGLTSKASGFLLGPSSWVPLLSGSFDGSTSHGILWRNSDTGAVAIWLMYNGLVPALAQVIFPASQWVPLMTADFDGDGVDDILWQHADGRVAIWLMQGNASSGVTAKASAVIFGPGTAWVPTFVADLDGDGRSDLVWGNTSTGDTAVWLMNGLAPKPGGTAIIFRGSSGWSVTHVVDLDGDGKSDLIWRNQTTGATAAWLMNGLAAKPGGAAILLTDANWEVTHHFRFNNDLNGDLVWRNGATGQTAIWLMNGLSAISSRIIFSAPDWTIYPPDLD